MRERARKKMVTIGYETDADGYRETLRPKNAGLTGMTTLSTGKPQQAEQQPETIKASGLMGIPMIHSIGSAIVFSGAIVQCQVAAHVFSCHYLSAARLDAKRLIEATC